MKKVFLFAAAAAMFAACSNEDGIAEQQIQQPKETPDFLTGTTPVGFDVYVNRATRAGLFGSEMTSTLLQGAQNAGGGFGVFAYYTDNNDYDQTALPNFMYNQGVFHDGSDWTYSPVKYWPNEFGTTAIAEDYDRISFFAYAPYVTVNAAGKVQTGDAYAADDANTATGIVGLSRNSVSGDPLVKYVAALAPANRVDLLWGVTGEDAADRQWSSDDGDTQAFEAKLPWLNLKRANTTAQKLKFNFLHALSKLNVQIDAYVDGDDNSNALATGTKIYVRSITFSGLATQGCLNLNNTEANKAQWLSNDGLTEIGSGQELTIYDGRKDGKEGTTAAANEKVTGFNSIITQDAVWASSAVGVTNTAVNLFEPSASLTDDAEKLADPIYVIPTGEPVNVTIVYDVETADDLLPTYVSDGAQHGSSIQNTITKTITFDPTGTPTQILESGKAYTLKLHLGMNSVKFDAAVTDWETEVEGNGDLPANTD